MTRTNKTAIVHRMVMPGHVCPYGLKVVALLRRKGFQVEDRWLTSREEVDAFKAEHNVATTPQAFVDGERIGGYTDLRRWLGLRTRDPKATTYRPVAAVFGVSALMALAVAYASGQPMLGAASIQWFIAFAMCLLAMLKLRDVESFSSMFLNYDLLAKHWVPYAYVYPWAELLAGVLMAAGALHVVSIPVALFIGTIGAVSVIKAVYVDKRELKCACVGGDTNVPLGFVSLSENLLMVGMALWMLAGGAVLQSVH